MVYMSTPGVSQNLPLKFLPFLIGSPTCSANIKTEIDEIFQKPLERLSRDNGLSRDNIFVGENWVFKLGRTEESSTTQDTYLYRVRKAEKIRSYIQKNNLDAHIAVPKKYLYWNGVQRQFYVVAEKMSLSREVAVPASKAIEDNFRLAGISGGQLRALANNAPQRSLTVPQAKALAELSVLGYTGLSYNNLFFTPDGKVAIIDTEPRKRLTKKVMKSKPSFFLFGDKGAMLSKQSIAGIAKLKLYTNDLAALQAVQKVEKNHVLWSIAKLITKICLVTLAIYFAPTITALVPIAAVAMTLKVSFIAVAVLKNLSLTANILDVYKVWGLSCQGLQGVYTISVFERDLQL